MPIFGVNKTARHTYAYSWGMLVFGGVLIYG